MTPVVRTSDHVLQVSGELDIATVQLLRDAVGKALAEGPAAVLVDLTSTRFLDSTGCRELVRTAKSGVASGVPVALVVPTENWRVRRVIDFMQFGELLPVHDEAPLA